MRLLKPTGVMVIAIDDYEMHRLRMLLDDLPFSSEVLGVVPIKNNPAGRTTVRAFAVAHEYAVFIARSSAARISRIERTPEQIARQGTGRNRVLRMDEFSKTWRYRYISDDATPPILSDIC